MNKNTKICTIILGICAFWLGGIPFIFSKALPVVCENISFNSNYDVIVEKPRLRLNIIPIATIKAKSLKIKTHNSNDYMFLDNPSVTVRLFPLLAGKVHINKIFVNDIEAEAVIKENIVLEKDFFNNFSKSRVFLDSFICNKFKTKIKTPEVNGIAVYEGSDIYYRKNGRYIKVNINSKISLNNQKSDITAKLYLPKNNDVNKSIINANVRNVDIAPLREYLKYYLPSDLKDLQGIVNIEVDKNHLTASLSDCSVIMEDDAKSMIFPKNLMVKSDFNITRKTVNIINSDISGENISANVNGTISNYIDKSISLLDLNIRLNKSKVESIISLLPPFKTEDIDAYKLKKYKFYGDTLGNFTIKGDILEPSIYGNVFINNGVLTKPIPNANGATIKLSFLGKYLNYDVTVPASQTEKVWVKGGVELYNVKYADMRVWSTKNVDLAIAEEKVVPIHEILNFVIGPVPIMDIKGKGNIDITVKGNRQNPHVWGTFNTINATAKFLEIPDLVLQNADAALSFDDENAVFLLNKGNINNKPSEIKGTCNLAGKFDFDLISNSQEISYLHNAIKTSTMLEDINKYTPDINKLEGLANLKIKIFGNIKKIEDLKINKNCFYKGQLDFLGNSADINNIKIRNIKGSGNFEGMDIDSKITARIGESPVNAELLLKNNIADLSLFIPKLKLADIADINKKTNKKLANIYTKVSLKYKGNIEKPEYDKINLEAEILNSDKNNILQLSNGNIILKNGRLNLKNINGYFLDTKSLFDINLHTDNFVNNSLYSGNINLKDFDLSLINLFNDCTLLPENIRKIIQNVRFEKGKINLRSTIRNNNINASTDLGGIEFVYTPLELPIKIINGSVYARRTFLGLNKINLLADGMPILIDGGINNIFDKQDYNIYINSKPKQEFIDKYINNNHIYPIKIKGDIVYWAKLKGTEDNLNINSEATLAPDSSFYYLGALVGDIENAIVLNLDVNVVKQKFLKIKTFSYDKIIASLSKRTTRLNMLKAKGGIDLYENDAVFHDLRIKTSNPTDARIFNIIFKKPNIKQGQFSSDLKINGKLSNPQVLGNFHIFETNIPFLDTTMKNISMNFGDKTIDINSAGEVLGNEIKFKGTLKNKLTRPYYVENAEIFAKVIDLNYLTEKLKSSQVDDYQRLNTLEKFSLSDLIIKNIKMSANGIQLRNLKAENVLATASLNEKQLLDISHFAFKIADGNLNGSFKYNLKNNNTQLNLRANKINANDITYAVFDLNNQIYGDLTGNMKLACDGTNFNKCLETLNGNTNFNVSNGRMPKLGSLEYLLRAGNLIKGGVTGISINGIIDIITPLKTGNFSDIIGNIDIKDGIAQDIEISTKGKDLSLFISGSYNFADENANMEVLGLLSKKISTMFGPLGNVSLNTLFNIIPGIDLTKESKLTEKINKIPGIELSEKSFRKFVAEIKGNINGDNYVKSFKWIN